MTRLLLRLGMPRSRAIRLGETFAMLHARAPSFWLNLALIVGGIAAGVAWSAMLPDRSIFP